MKQRANNDIRQAAQEANIFLWEIADYIGVADCNFSRKLRRELSDDEKSKIKGVINQIQAEREGNYAAHNKGGETGV